MKLYLLGDFRAQRADGAPTALRRKTRAFAAYLAATGRDHTRQQLIDLFCAEARDPAAVLRSLLSRARSNLSDAEGEAILTAAGRIRFNPELWVDVQQFGALADADSLSTARLGALLDLYRGEFLADISLDQAPEFGFWLLGERARYRSLYEQGLLAAVERLTAAGDFDAAIRRAQELVAGNVLHETAHGRLIWLYARTGRYEAARNQYHRLRDLLAQELAVEPTPDLQLLYADVVAGRVRGDFSAPPAPPLPAPAPTSPLTILGRERELSRLAEAWEAARAGPGQVVLVEAEAGGGKSHLLRAFAQSLPADYVFTGEGYESAQAIPFAPWLDLLEQLLAAAGGDLTPYPDVVAAAVAHLLPGRASSAAAPDLPTERLFAALATLLLDGPRVLVIDNLQWADPSTLQLFQYLARRVAGAPVLLLGLTRPAGDDAPLETLLDDLTRQGAHALRPLPLRPAQVVDLLAAQWPRLPAGFRPHVAGMLHSATGGNPLFLTEVVRELAPSDGVPDALPVPDSVRDLIRRRLRRLSASTQQVVESLAVLHAAAPSPLLQQVSGRSAEETIRALDVALQRGLVDLLSDDRFDFHHDLMREAILQQLTPLRRRLLHRRAAAALAPHARAATLAYHWQRAGDEAEEARWAARAGEEAYAIYANEDAERYLERALALAPRAAIWLRLGDLRRRTGRWEEARDAYRQAENLAGDDRGVAVAQAALGRLAVDSGHNAEARRLLTAAVARLAQDAPAPSLGEALSNLASLHLRAGEYQQALARLEESLDVARALADEAAVARRIGSLGVVYLTLGDLDRAQESLEDALARSRLLDLPESIANHLAGLGNVFSYREDYDTALRYYHEAKEIDESLGNRAAVLRHTGNLGLEYHGKGDDRNALRYLLEAWGMGREMGNQRVVAIVVGNVGLIMQDLGALDAARRCHAWSLRADLTAGHAEAVARHLANLGTIAAWEEDDGPAQRCWELALALFEQSRHPYFYAHLRLRLAELAWSQGDGERALLLLDAAQAVAARREQYDYLPGIAALRARIAVARGDLTPDAARETLAEWLTHPAVAPAERAIVRYALWQISGDDEDRTAAAAAYAALYRRKAHWQFRHRYETLTGETLPPPDLGPLPPDFPADDIPALPPLLAEVDAFYATLPADRGGPPLDT